MLTAATAGSLLSAAPASADESIGLPKPRVEVLAMRTADAKHFRNPDGSYTSLFGKNIHYRDDAAQWQDVDLAFRVDAAGFVADRNAVIVRAGADGVSAVDRYSGIGVRWHTPEPAAVVGRTATFEADGLTWTYATRKSGIKLSAVVPASRGPKTYTFSYDLIGGSPLTVDPAGDLHGDGFTIPRGFAIGAKRQVYPAGPWRLIGDDQVAFDFDDNALPPEAFPYELDPSTQFAVAAGADDGEVGNRCSTYPPTCANKVAFAGFDPITVERSKDSNPTNPYQNYVSLVRWNTSSIPDDATLASSSPTVTLRTSQVRNDDFLGLSAGWYSAWGIGTEDYTSNADTSALTFQSLSTASEFNDNFITLENHTGISKTGYSGLRFTITYDGASASNPPEGINLFWFASYESTAHHEPYLEVTWIANTVPSIVSVTDSPDPVDSGGTVTWTVNYSDTIDDTDKALICKTNAVSAGACSGGTWASSGLVSSSPINVSYTTTASDTGVKNYWAFVCDSKNACSSGSPGTFTVRPHQSSASASPTTVEVGGSITFSANWSGSTGSVRARVCKQSSTCAFGVWASGSLTSSSPATVTVTTTTSDVGQYFANVSVCTSDGACSESHAVFITVRDTPTITSATDSPDPATPGSPVTFSVGWTDSVEQVRAVICKTNTVSSGSCPGGQWAIGEPSAASPSTASYVTTEADLGTQTYYASPARGRGRVPHR